MIYEKLSPALAQNCSIMISSAAGLDDLYDLDARHVDAGR